MAPKLTQAFVDSVQQEGYFLIQKLKVFVSEKDLALARGIFVEQ